jgi:very-short-patch-repair endonuclease
VYAAGHEALGRRGRAVAATLAGGDDSVLSHRSAGADWEVRPEPPTPEITRTRGRSRSRPDLIVHRSTTLDPRDVVVRAGLRVTAPERTLLDLATVEPPAALARAVAEAQVLRLVTPASLRGVVGRTPGHRGIAALLAALEGPGAAPTRSHLERAMLRLIRAAGLPRPQTNARIAGHTADFAWPEHRLIVETDGWDAHGHRLAFERDRARDTAHTLAGWTVVRFTWRQLTDEPLRVAAQIAALLSRADPAGRRSAA